MNTQNLKERHKIEREFHDQIALNDVQESYYNFYNLGALERADTFSEELLGNVKDKQILDYGCGTGYKSHKFARMCSRVFAIDISFESLKSGKRTSEEKRLNDRIFWIAMIGECLAFKSETFDLIYGHSILHHLDLDYALPEIARLLKKGGRAVFLEPLDTNPAIRLFRKLTPTKRTPTEKPLTFKQIHKFEKHFSEVHHREFYFISLFAYAWNLIIPNDKLYTLFLNILGPFDDFLLKWIPPLRYFCWITVLEFKKSDKIINHEGHKEVK